MPPDILISSGFPEDQRPAAARLFWEAFSGKLGKVLAPKEKALRLIERILDPAFAISALDREGQLLGLAGYKTADGSFAAGNLDDMTAVYGQCGGLLRGVFVEVLERKIEPDCLLMDGIFVAESARGRGIGGTLLNAIAEEARRRSLSRVRLDVIDTNPRAKALYERSGFTAVGEEKTGFLELLFGFSSATRMEKQV
ncbi:GNAT family N-acetyltransferase [Roseibium sp. FZY0029]|uniref:GNAT family N-acetyltransferase n=1 Tax=Roseibium sp. FZY0029 TaxID=3116647 RepID=UPI002EC30E6F|nr:GNAT family N-acetyltransferase [Roseibium sp. FZY0029]